MLRLETTHDLKIHLVNEETNLFADIEDLWCDCTITLQGCD